MPAVALDFAVGGADAGGVGEDVGGGGRGPGRVDVQPSGFAGAGQYQQADTAAGQVGDEPPQTEQGSQGAGAADGPGPPAGVDDVPGAVGGQRLGELREQVAQGAVVPGGQADARKQQDQAEQDREDPVEAEDGAAHQLPSRRW
ncbi:hypothetical protein Ari01nite_93190 [Paractinoplanes rishiriensis]|uniref:Uncharacterized protein n=1 Tax=Paractinoplanes rishiriensis TaxID=1050105 RepID=A0A919KAQ5_9ACTN|nr:hypothetical protein Ari01nite_93190 [Actinoplanes rishiriensis]